MKKSCGIAAVVIFSIAILLTVVAAPAAAQGPAGAGAAAASQDTSHSLNPIKWVKKDPKDSAEAPGSRNDAEKKLTSILQAQGLLPAATSATDACASFTALDGCLAALHASHNLALDFNCLRADVTGVHTSADVSGCKLADGEKSQSLSKAIHELKPDANAKQATKEAEQQAKDDLKAIGG
jgi:hypothetical protein